jgi:hypothetical protein
VVICKKILLFDKKGVSNMENSKTIKIGTWTIKSYTELEYAPRAVISSLEKFLNKEWLNAVLKYPCEDRKHIWAGLKKYKIPAPIIRIELSPLCKGKKNIKNWIYSIGKRPSSGILPLVTNYCPEHRNEIRNSRAYNLDGFIQIGSLVQDDKYLAELLGVPYFTKIPYDEPPENYDLNDDELKEYQMKCLKGQYYWTRHDPNKEYPPGLLELLESISLVPVRGDGCNSEFMVLGMAKRLSEILPERLSWQDIDQLPALQKVFNDSLPWNESFVIKLVQGLWGKDVLIYHINDSQEARAITKEQIKHLVRTLGPRKLMLQPYIPDRVVEREGKLCHEIWKLYFARLEEGYAFTGGMVQGSNRSRKVCGINDTYFTPLLTR